MIRVSVEVCSGPTRIRAAVWADGIQQALALVRSRYPGAEAAVIFPIDPEGFFVKGLAPVPNMVLPEPPQLEAG